MEHINLFAAIIWDAAFATTLFTCWATITWGAARAFTC